MKAVVIGIVFLSVIGTAVYFATTGDHGLDSAQDIGELLERQSDREASELIDRFEKDQKEKADPSLPQVSETGPWPRIEFEETTFNFGSMGVLIEDTHEFTIRNTGEAPLEMKTGESTCKCTRFEVEKKVLAPGEETKVIISWKPKSREASFRHGGKLHTNDPQNKIVNFAVTGAVEDFLEILPERWTVDAVYEDSPGTLTAKVGSRLFDELPEPQLISKSGLVTATFHPMDIGELRSVRMKSGWQVSLQVSPEIPVGRFEEDVRIVFHEIDQDKGVTVAAQRYGNVTVRPFNPPQAFIEREMELQMGQFSSSEGKSVEVLLIVNQKGLTEDLNVTVAESNPPGFTAEISPLGAVQGDFGRYRMKVSYPAGLPRALRNTTTPGKLELHTNLPNGESVAFWIRMNAF
ncbi:MAG: DUF1573 domain-containing protein [Planctomycetaceae bacterium]|nr:DUF1573 domain-containing protein [Planctomycetaceae bacterium]